MLPTTDRSSSREIAAITAADEIAHYDEVAGSEKKFTGICSAVTRVQSLQASWAVPLTSWLDSVHDCAAQADVYVHLSASVINGRVLQLGGTGQAALKALVGGAAKAYLLTPSAGEARLAEQVADTVGLSDRFTAVVGFAESLPFTDGAMTAIISEGCLHHTNTPAALRECSRVLQAGGRFGAWEPWKARLYEIGISIFGKRDPSVNCRPMDAMRIAQLPTIFPKWSEVRLHGAISRYPGIVWSRYVRPLTVSNSYRITVVDDHISKRFPAAARNGSSCAVLAVR